MSSLLPRDEPDADAPRTEPLAVLDPEERSPGADDDAAALSAAEAGGLPDDEADAESEDGTTADDDAARPRSGRAARIIGWAAAVVLSLFVLLCAVLGLGGYRAYIMETASMGTSAPVGALVVTQPAQVADLRAGDIVTVAPSAGGTTHTHRVVSVDGSSAQTQGDLNGTPDPERVVQGNLEGCAVVVAPVLGWITKMLPIVLVVLIASMLLTVRVRDPRSRFRYRALGLFCGVALAVVIVKPLLGVQLLSMKTDQDADGPFAEAHVVSTGIFPVSVAPAEDHGTATDVLAPTGADGMARADEPSDGGKFTFYPRVELTSGWWLGAVLYCASPFVVFGIHQRVTRQKGEVSA